MAFLGLSFLFPRASPQDISFLALGIQDADDTILAMGTMSCKFLVSLARKAYGRCSGDTGLYTCFSIFQTRVTCRSRWRHTHTHPRGSHAIHGKHMGVPFLRFNPKPEAPVVYIKQPRQPTPWVHSEGMQGGLLRSICGVRTGFQGPNAF